jgi:hypothetical protein
MVARFGLFCSLCGLSSPEIVFEIRLDVIFCHGVGRRMSRSLFSGAFFCSLHVDACEELRLILSGVA